MRPGAFRQAGRVHVKLSRNPSHSFNGVQRDRDVRSRSSDGSSCKEPTSPAISTVGEMIVPFVRCADPLTSQKRCRGTSAAWFLSDAYAFCSSTSAHTAIRRRVPFRCIDAGPWKIVNRPGFLEALFCQLGVCRLGFKEIIGVRFLGGWDYCKQCLPSRVGRPAKRRQIKPAMSQRLPQIQRGIHRAKRNKGQEAFTFSESFASEVSASWVAASLFRSMRSI